MVLFCLAINNLSLGVSKVDYCEDEIAGIVAIACATWDYLENYSYV